MNEDLESNDLGHEEEFYRIRRGIQGKFENFVDSTMHEARIYGVSVAEYAQLLIANELEVISYSLFHLAKFLQPQSDGMVKFGEFAARYLARHGTVSEAEMQRLYEDYTGIKLKPGDEGSRVPKDREAKG